MTLFVLLMLVFDLSIVMRFLGLNRITVLRCFNMLSNNQEGNIIESRDKEI